MEKTDEGRPDGVTEIVADHGYHSDRTLVELENRGLRSYVSEPDRGRRNWKDGIDAQQAPRAPSVWLRPKATLTSHPAQYRLSVVAFVVTLPSLCAPLRQRRAL
jgi:hypothetical protein